MKTTTLLVACLTALPAAASAQDLEARLGRMAEALEAARERTHVPGMSLAVVKDDAIVWSGGFGVADLESDRAADAETVYAAGSTTKAFTAALIGMLADDGRLDWDDPVTAHLPWFDLAVDSPDPEAACTLRDLLSHRHGFTRMSMLWAGGGAVSREDILRTAAGAEPFAPFRERFHYCNVTYLAAGVAAGAAAESSWDELMRTRLLEPLGMSSATLTVAEARADERLAVGYRWLPSEERHEPSDMIELEAIGPAGSLNANVLDMARWIRFQLGRGALEGQRLISAERLEETWAPQISIGQGIDYGLGWMLREVQGHRVVEHGGNIDGFSAQVTLVPEANLGFVLLLNLDAAPLREASIGLILNELLDEGDAQQVAEASAPAEPAADVGDLDAYTGIYVANFANFDEEPFEVTAADGRLTLDIPSQQAFALLPPDEDGRWQFELTDQIAVVFERGADDAVVGITLYQGPYTFEIPREGIEPTLEVPLEQLEPYTGTYIREIGGRQVEIAIRRNRLGLVDREGWIPFHTPDEDGHAVLRVRPDQGATFHMDEDGFVDSFTFHGDAGDRLFTRAADEELAELPSTDELMALRAEHSAGAASATERTSGEVYLPQAGLRGRFTFVSEGRSLEGARHVRRLDFGKFGYMDVLVANGEAWRGSSVRGVEQLYGHEATQALLEHPAAVAGDWREFFEEVRILRSEPWSGREAYVVKLAHAELPERTYWVDAETGDVLRAKMTVLERGMRIPATIEYADYEAAENGARMPRTITMENQASGRTVLTIEAYEADVELTDEAFSLER